MRMLLTSAGLTNKSIVQALSELAGKPFSELAVVFIPTAANVEEDNKVWLVDDMFKLRRLNFKNFDVVDISALAKNIWLPRLEKADIICVGGGNEFYLMECMKNSGLSELLPNLLKSKVYIGISAGSMIMGRTLSLVHGLQLYYEDVSKYSDEKGFGFVDFNFYPHLNSPQFPDVREPDVAKLATGEKHKMYVLDDQSALKVVDDKVEVITEGKYLILNQS